MDDELEQTYELMRGGGGSFGGLPQIIKTHTVVIRNEAPQPMAVLYSRLEPEDALEAVRSHDELMARLAYEETCRWEIEARREVRLAEIASEERRHELSLRHEENIFCMTGSLLKTAIEHGLVKGSFTGVATSYSSYNVFFANGRTYRVRLIK